MNFLETNQTPANIQPKKMMKKALVTLFVLLLLASIAAAGYFYLQWSELKSNPSKVSENELQSTIDAVGKLILLPTDETPTVATVSDLEPLKNQTFFAHATVGDKVLVYNNAKKAYLYNPTENKLIDVTTINPNAVAPVDTNGKPSIGGTETNK